MHCYLYKSLLQLTSCDNKHTTLILTAHLVSEMVSSRKLKFSLCWFMCSCSMRSWHCSGWSAPAQWGRQRCSRPGFSSSLWWACLCTFILHKPQNTNTVGNIITAGNAIFSWNYYLFLFPPQTKSMAHHLFLTSKLDVPRRQRFPDRFVDDIAALVCAISADIASRYHKVNRPQSYTTSNSRNLLLKVRMVSVITVLTSWSEGTGLKVFINRKLPYLLPNAWSLLVSLI